MLIDKILHKNRTISNAKPQKIPQVNSCSPEDLYLAAPPPVVLLLNDKNNM